MQTIVKMFNTDKWVLPYLRRYKKLLTLVIFLGFMTVFCGTALMFVSGYLISRSAQHPSNILLVYVPIVLTRAFGIGRPVFRYAERLTSHNWVLRLVSDLRKKLYLKVEQRATTIRQEKQTGDILALLADDIQHIENLYLQTIFPVVIGWLLYVVFALFVGYFNWAFGLLMLLLFGIITILLPLVSVALNGARSFKNRQLQHEVYVNLTDGVLGLTDWVIAGRQAEFVEKQTTLMDQQVKIQSKDMQFTWWRDFVLNLIVAGITFVMLYFGESQFGNSYLNVNYIAAFTLAIFPTVDAFQSISAGLTEIPTHQASLERMNRYDDLEVEKPIAANVNREELLAFKEITFTDVSFHYPNQERDVLNQITLPIKRKQTYALLGPSGAGKSTMLQLLLGDLQPTQGQIKVDGHDLNTLTDYRHDLFGVLDQQPYLFNTSIMNNVRLGNLNATDDQVKAAIAAVGLTDLVENLPAGYETVMTEGGQRFSGGERQRFALARILLQDAPIIILDEPTVSLDPITENEVLTTIFTLLADKTIIWVTHHLTGINFADQVYFLDAGQFTMSGTPQDLYAHNQHFKQLLDLDTGVVNS
ncbi:thiol reductant ABC exporter subunit CydC [Periweissella fabaria]|uniref:ABC transporter ATP-binding/permease protein n=1 Tax=Periweissella fabaria TaxID=546157 RepID=A0ABN8BND2_9LACO|nr:thiol reductant ABC exporter subunit CydC [Periweissella fabaria]MCM0598002.1 thiol reductant ABC exporter subunit CydC [Periweissella fabaria]CAH0417397.1 putative ABC transporter ATP-binding/permease protein [Periweissella fabaria]